MFQETYYQFIQNSMAKAYEENKEAIEQAAKMLYETEVSGHRIYTFGTGHSHMIGEDLYGRAGGYAKIYPIMEIEMTLLTHPTKSTKLERTPGYADVLDVLYELHEGDAIIAASNSGRNPLVVEYIMRAKEKGVKIIAVTSLEHSKASASRHESGKRLFELADIVLNNMAPLGDAGVAIGGEVAMGPISTISGCFLAQCVIGRMVELLQENRKETPVFWSSNKDGGDEANKELFEKYAIKKI